MARIGQGFQFGKIPQYDTDPTNPQPGDIWVLKQGNTPVFKAFMGLGFPYIRSVTKYRLSYRTTESTTIRAILS